ncbi:MAG: hypothetical protein AAB267_07160, partial [Candidatus Desantisbacteria bacterium]
MEDLKDMLHADSYVSAVEKLGIKLTDSEKRGIEALEAARTKDTSPVLASAFNIIANNRGVTINSLLESAKQDGRIVVVKAWISQLNNFKELSKRTGLSVDDLLVISGVTVARDHTGMFVGISSLNPEEKGNILLKNIDKTALNNLLNNIGVTIVNAVIIRIVNGQLEVTSQEGNTETKSLEDVNKQIAELSKKSGAVFDVKVALITNDGTLINMENSKIGLESASGNFHIVRGDTHSYITSQGRVVRHEVLCAEIKIKFNVEMQEGEGVFGYIITAQDSVTGASLVRFTVTENKGGAYSVSEDLPGAVDIEQQGLAKDLALGVINTVIELNTGQLGGLNRLNVSEGINQVQAIFSVAFSHNTLFEIPTGFGKTKVLFAGVNRVNQILRERDILPGRHTVYVLHNANEFQANADENSPANKYFKAKGMNVVSIVQNNLSTDGLVNPITLDEIRRDPLGVADRLANANTVYIEADTLMFLQLMVRNAIGTEAQADAELVWSRFCNNAKMIHDEVDTAFFRNRAQEGMGARELTDVEAQAIETIYQFVYSLKVKA